MQFNHLNSKPRLPKIEQFNAYVDSKIGEILNHSVAYDDELYQRYHRTVALHWQQHRSLNNLSPKLFNKLRIIAVLSYDDQEKLIEDEQFRREWLNLISTRNNSRAACRIYQAVLQHYDSYASYLAEIFAVIAPVIKNSPLPRCQSLAALDAQYGVFSANLVNNIADHIMCQLDQPIDTIFTSLQLNTTLRGGELGAAIGKTILAKNFSRLTHNDNSLLARTIDYFSDEQELRLPYLLNDILQSLLGNYLDNDPPDDTRTDIEKFTDTHLGDPRISPKWHGVREKLRRVVERWKVGVTLQAFFALLDHVARNDATHDRHWQARKKFWQGYLDRREITAAWLVLGKRYLHNRDFFPAGDIAYGQFSTHAGIETSHCAIIMRIKGYVLSEWSHSGALRIWEDNDRRCPQFNRKQYHPNELKKLGIYDRGRIPHQGDWQGRVQRFLAGQATFRLWR